MPYKVAVVTPYYKEPSDVLSQCHDSVMAQTYPCDHIVVSDGHANPLFDGRDRTLHVTLPLSNGDNGNTPRGVGSLLAERYGYDAVAYLDADNWFTPDHIANMVEAREHSRRPIVVCKRTFHDLDGNLLAITEPDEDNNQHVDTSCFVVFRPAFSVFRAWFMPKELGPLCDRIFLKTILHDRFRVCILDSRTVAFRTQYAFHYRLAKMAIPKGAKETDAFQAAAAYLLDNRNTQSIVNKLGFYPRLAG